MHPYYQDVHMEYEFSLPSSVQGYHIYQGIQKPTIGEELRCIREPRNVVDRYAVTVVKEKGCERTAVGHFPRKYRKYLPCFFIAVHGVYHGSTWQN